MLVNFKNCLKNNYLTLFMLSYFFWLEPESSSRGCIRIWIQMENFVDLYPVPDPHEMRIKNTDKHKDHYFFR